MTDMADRSGARFRGWAQKGYPPTILQIVPALNGGGVEQGVVDLNAAIAAAGGRSIVVSSGGRRVPEITRAKGLHVQLPVRSKNPFVMLMNVRRLRALIRAHNVDIVHACSRAPAWSAARAVIGTAARYVTSCHAAHKISGKLKRFYNSSIAGGERVIAVSKFLADYLEHNYRVDPAKIRVVHRGLALERFRPEAVTPDRMITLAQQWRIPDGSSVILLPARLSRIKGHQFLLDAVRRLTVRDLFCLFIGETKGGDGARRELEDYINIKDMGHMVRIAPHCADMPAAYMLATVVVSPSLVPEGFGRVAIEAQAMGRPLIVTNHGGAQETVLPGGETGWLVAPGDVDGLAATLRETLALDLNQREALARRAQAHILKSFSNDVMCGATLDVYAELLDERLAQAMPRAG